MRLGLGLQRGRRRLSSDPLAGVEGRALDLRPDSSTMYVDAEGTQPASVGGPVGRWEDQSGLGHHATQATQSAKPTLQQREDGTYYLDFDGVDDHLEVSTHTSFSQWVALFHLNPAQTRETATELLKIGDRFELRLDQFRDTGKLGITKLGDKDYVSNLDTPYGEPSVVVFSCDGNELKIKSKEQTDTIAVTPEISVESIGNNTDSIKGSLFSVLILDGYLEDTQEIERAIK